MLTITSRREAPSCGGTDGQTDGQQKCPSIFFKLCGHLEHVYDSRQNFSTKNDYTFSEKHKYIGFFFFKMMHIFAKYIGIFYHFFFQKSTFFSIDYVLSICPQIYSRWVCFFIDNVVKFEKVLFLVHRWIFFCYLYTVLCGSQGTFCTFR